MSNALDPLIRLPKVLELGLRHSWVLGRVGIGDASINRRLRIADATGTDHCPLGWLENAPGRRCGTHPGHRSRRPAQRQVAEEIGKSFS